MDKGSLTLLTGCKGTRWGFRWMPLWYVYVVPDSEVFQGECNASSKSNYSYKERNAGEKD